MKCRFFFVLTFALLSTQVDAQNFLQRVGRAVNAVKSQIPQKPSSGDDSRGSNAASQAAGAVSRASASADRGENVTRQSGLDYVDEYGVNHGGGILIGGILWAPVNCGYHATQYPYGKLYQWGRLHGQGYGAPYAGQKSPINADPAESQPEIVPGPTTPTEARKHPGRFYSKSDMALFNWCENDMKLWCNFTDDGKMYKNKTNDPCPEGWRLPDLQDYNNLIAHYSEAVTHPETGQKGRWFSGPQPYSNTVQRIFLPMPGYRSLDGKCNGREGEACYWSLRHGGGEGLVWHLYFTPSKVETNPMAYPHEAYSVRCVKDMPGQQMR